MPPPLTPPKQQGASLPLLPLPYRKPQSRSHLAATQGRHAFIHTSVIDIDHIRGIVLIGAQNFFLAHHTFSAFINDVPTSDKWKATGRQMDIQKPEMSDAFQFDPQPTEERRRTSLCTVLSYAGIFFFFFSAHLFIFSLLIFWLKF